MNAFDETDIEILRLLAEDARRPYSEVAERVDLSPPAVSDRVEKLEDYGIIRRFTLDMDRSQLRRGTPVLVTLTIDPDAIEGVRNGLLETDGVEHVFATADARVVCYAHAPTSDVRSWLFGAVDSDVVRNLDIGLITDADRTIQVGGETAFALTCVECGNEVGPEGVTRRIDGDPKYFCCPSCETLYLDRYEELAEGAD